MATPAQCYYCFESLAASFEYREPASLEIIEELWEQHERAKKVAELGTTNELVKRLVGAGSGEDEDDELDGNHEPSGQKQLGDLKIPNTTHLNPQSSSDSSSASTTPSVFSAVSSRSLSTGVTTPSGPPDTSLPQAVQKTNQRYPLFVTWDTLSRNGHKSLRGCIGTFEAQELGEGLQSYALTSAFDDTRFSPIPSSLLPSLSCSLTLLGSFEPCTNAMDWTLGTHGLRISFIHRGRRYGATYLPDVAVEQGWTKEETVESLMRKAGWDSASSGGSIARRILRGSSSGGDGGHGASTGKPWDQVSDFRAVRYQGLKASASYAEWQEWRSWVLGQKEGSAKLLPQSHK